MKQVSSIYIINKDKLLMQYNPKQKAWLLPGGFLEENEFVHNAGIRETCEEIGETIAGSLVFLGFKTLDNPNLDYRTKLLPTPIFIAEQTLTDGRIVENFIYLAKTDITKIDNDEFKAKWIPYAEIDTLDTFDNVKIQVKYIFSNLDKFDELPY